MISEAGDGEREVILSPLGSLTERAKMRACYQMLFGDLEGEKAAPVRRLYGEDFLTDETTWHRYVNDGRSFLCNGKSGQVSLRLLHAFNYRGGKVSRGRAWCEMAALQQQLEGRVSLSSLTGSCRGRESLRQT